MKNAYEIMEDLEDADPEAPVVLSVGGVDYNFNVQFDLDRVRLVATSVATFEGGE